MKTIKKLSQTSSRLLCSTNIISSIFSVVKELIENALDSEAANIEVKLENCGLDKIEVRDNGCGIKKCDIPFVAKPHFTSKISSHEDLAQLETYGFRGEALGALCAISDMSITTKTDDDDMSTIYTFNKSGDVTSSQPSPLPCGTVVTVCNLFNDIPVRKKYYRSEKHKKDEVKKIEDLLCCYGCAQVGTRFALYHNKSMIWQKPAASDLKTALMQVIGASAVSHMDFKSMEDENCQAKVEAYLPRCTAIVQAVTRSTNDKCIVLVNKRPVRIKNIDKALQEACCQSLSSQDTKSRFPICYVSLNVPPSRLDVNIDPNKTQILLHDFDNVLNFLKSFLKSFYTENVEHLPNSGTNKESSKSNNKKVSTSVNGKIKERSILINSEASLLTSAFIQEEPMKNTLSKSVGHKKKHNDTQSDITSLDWDLTIIKECDLQRPQSTETAKLLSNLTQSTLQDCVENETHFGLESLHKQNTKLKQKLFHNSSDPAPRYQNLNMTDIDLPEPVQNTLNRSLTHNKKHNETQSDITSLDWDLTIIKECDLQHPQSTVTAKLLSNLTQSTLQDCIENETNFGLESVHKQNAKLKQTLFHNSSHLAPRYQDLNRTDIDDPDDPPMMLLDSINEHHTQHLIDNETENLQPNLHLSMDYGNEINSEHESLYAQNAECKSQSASSDLAKHHLSVNSKLHLGDVNNLSHSVDENNSTDSSLDSFKNKLLNLPYSKPPSIESLNQMMRDKSKDIDFDLHMDSHIIPIQEKQIFNNSKSSTISANTIVSSSDNDILHNDIDVQSDILPNRNMLNSQIQNVTFHSKLSRKKKGDILNVNFGEKTDIVPSKLSHQEPIGQGNINHITSTINRTLLPTELANSEDSTAVQERKKEANCNSNSRCPEDANFRLKWSHGKMIDSSGKNIQPAVMLSASSSSPKRALENGISEISAKKKKNEFTSNNNHLKPVQKSISAFEIFCHETRREIIAENPDFSNQDIARILMERWKNLPTEQKIIFKEMAMKQYHKSPKTKKKLSDKLSQALSQQIPSPTKSRKISNGRTLKPKRKIKEVKLDFDIEKLKAASKRRGTKVQAFAEDEECKLRPINNVLSPGIWICCDKSNILLLNSYRMQETLLYNRLLKTFQLKSDELEEPLTVTPELVRSTDLWYLLLECCSDTASSYTEQDSLTANGFDIRVIRDEYQISVRIIGMATCIPSYGISDLIEILHILKKEGMSVELSNCRPTKVLRYLQNEAVRIAKQSLIIQRKQELNDLLTQCQQYLPPQTITCFHNKPFYEQLFDISEL